MKEIEIYDILTLGDGSEYTVVQMLQYEGKTYYLIAPVDEEEEPDMEQIKIVEAIRKEQEMILTEQIEENKLKKLSRLFLSSIKDFAKEQ